MKMNSNLKRLSALILASGIAVATASADATTATRELITRAATTVNTSMPKLKHELRNEKSGQVMQVEIFHHGHGEDL